MVQNLYEYCSDACTPPSNAQRQFNAKELDECKSVCISSAQGIPNKVYHPMDYSYAGVVGQGFGDTYRRELPNL